MDDLWSSFEAEVAESSARFTDQCCVAVYLDSLDDNARELAIKAFKNDKISISSLYMALSRRGFPNGRTAVALHKGLRCTCTRESVVK